ncbi:MAG: hypothetical protein IT382_00155, partial [Deltaproteobacteria bacterium]|nr:hypothetical protein [Deltaproteobacteria bacterium]
KFVLGAEESYGYLAGAHVRDKDAAVSSMLMAELAAAAKAAGLVADGPARCHGEVGDARRDLQRRVLLLQPLVDVVVADVEVGVAAVGGAVEVLAVGQHRQRDRAQLVGLGVEHLGQEVEGDAVVVVAVEALHVQAAAAGDGRGVGLDEAAPHAPAGRVAGVAVKRGVPREAVGGGGGVVANLAEAADDHLARVDHVAAAGGHGAALGRRVLGPAGVGGGVDRARPGGRLGATHVGVGVDGGVGGSADDGHEFLRGSAGLPRPGPFGHWAAGDRDPD